MSVENATLFLDAMDEQPEVFSKLGACKEAVQLGETMELLFTVDDFHTAMRYRNERLSQEDMQQMSGGAAVEYVGGCIWCPP